MMACIGPVGCGTSGVTGGRRRRVPFQSESARISAARAATMALVVTALVGSSVQSLAAEPPPPPAPDRVWGGCELSESTALNGFAISGTSSFVLIYTMANDNGGQLFTAGRNRGRSTGVVVCTNPEEVGIETIDEATDIPDGIDSGTPAATSVDILDADELLLLRYRLNGGVNDGVVEQRICPSTSENATCGRISPIVDGGCELTDAAITELENSIERGDRKLDPQVDFAVVYDNQNQHVVCGNPVEVGIETTTETTDIPNAHDHLGVDSVDILDADEGLVLRYRLNGGTNDGVGEQRICHSANENVDCFRISRIIP